jgi:hypothetical protein
MNQVPRRGGSDGPEGREGDRQAAEWILVVGTAGLELGDPGLELELAGPPAIGDGEGAVSEPDWPCVRLTARWREVPGLIDELLIDARWWLCMWLPLETRPVARGPPYPVAGASRRQPRATSE